mmetsp:Transcript_33099/g.76269  ORF Transcript_33099/g.76269 Transcript_33099/m.76269 type:complete len:148 (-) Transcript_33099:415-858(-)
MVRRRKCKTFRKGVPISGAMTHKKKVWERKKFSITHEMNSRESKSTYTYTPVTPSDPFVYQPLRHGYESVCKGMDFRTKKSVYARVEYPGQERLLQRLPLSVHDMPAHPGSFCLFIFCLLSLSTLLLLHMGFCRDWSPKSTSKEHCW